MSTQAHAASPAIYSKVLGALVVLTVITVLAAGVNFGAANVVIALVIASIKGSLVALFFMHLRHDKPMSAIIFVTGLVMLAVFLILCVIDTGSRDRIRPPRRSLVRPAAATPVAMKPAP